jgi:hypothetical protein
VRREKKMRNMVDLNRRERNVFNFEKDKNILAFYFNII